MNLLHLKVSIVWFILCFVILPFAGFVFRSAQLQKKQRRILELEEEMIASHAEILALQKQLVVPQSVPIRAIAIDESRQFSDNASKGKLKVNIM